MKELLIEMMKQTYIRAIGVGRECSTATSPCHLWNVGGLQAAEKLIRENSEALGIDVRDIPKEPGLYWVEVADGFLPESPAIVRVRWLGSAVLVTDAVHPKADHSWTACPLDDPRVVRYLGRVNPEPIPMGG